MNIYDTSEDRFFNQDFLAAFSAFFPSKLEVLN